MHQAAPSPAVTTKLDVPPVFQTKLIPESDVLIVSFSGLGAAVKGQERPFDFFMTTKMLEYNRIMVRDPYDLFYLSGVDENGFEHLVERLRSEIARIAPKQTIFIGASAGGYAAVLFGHLLGADFIHAFGTRGHFKLEKILRQGDIKSLMNRLPTIFRLSRTLPKKHRRFLDLKSFLLEGVNPNPRTKTHLHACAYCVDAARAKYLGATPGTRVFLYPCSEHNIAGVLLKSHCLHAMLQRENLARAEEVYEDFYGGFDPAQPASSLKKTKGAEPLRLAGGSSPDGRFEVYAVEGASEESAAGLEIRERETGKVALDLGSSRVVGEARGYTLPINTELLWNGESRLFVLKMRDSKTSSRISLYRVAEGAIAKIPGPDLLGAVKKALGYEFTGRFYLETPLRWETADELAMNVKGNTVKSIDEAGDHDYDFNFRVRAETGEILGVEENKRALPPP